MPKQRKKPIDVEESILPGFIVKLIESPNKIYSIELWRSGRHISTLAPFFDREEAIKEIPAYLERGKQFAH